MTNLLKETEEILKQNDIEITDILWIGSSKDDFYIPLENALEIMNVEYHSGFGAPEIAEDLIVAGKDWWLERHEYDGSEWWEFKRTPIKPNECRTVRRVDGGTWSTLSEINGR